MTDYIRNLTADVVNRTTVDNNAKIEDGTGGAIAQLAAMEDEFGTSINNWTELDGGNEIDSVFPNKSTFAFVEDSATALTGYGQRCGVLASAGNAALGNQHDSNYLDADVAIYQSNVYAPVSGNKNEYFILRKSLDNYVQIRREMTTDNRFRCGKVINGVTTELEHSDVIVIGPPQVYWLRIKRVAETNTFTFYYALTDPIADSDNWVELWSGIITDATHFKTTDRLYPVHCRRENSSGSVNDITEWFRQITDNYYWPDSPECDIIDSSAGAVDYAFDAGSGNFWALAGASHSVSVSGTGAVKYKLGYSDTGADGDVTWVDATWKTIAEVNTNAGNGDYDDHRYIHVKAQFVSGGPDYVKINSFTITSGSAVHTWSIDNTSSREGSYSFKQEGPAGFGDDYQAQKMKVLADEDYHVSAFIDVDSAPTTGYFYLQVYDNTNDAEIAIAKAAQATSSYRKLSTYFTIPAGCTEIEIRIGGNTKGGTAYWDCVDCVRTRAKEYS